MDITRREMIKGIGGLAGAVALGGIDCTTSQAPAGQTPGIPAGDDVTLEAKGMRLLGANDLGGHGAMGEGIALQKLKDGRRIAYLANEPNGAGMSIVDVTDPKKPQVLKYVQAENGDARFNSLSMTGDVLVVARQTTRIGQVPAGIIVYDASKPEELRQLSYFSTAGPFSRGCHFVWFVDGRYAHLSTGMPDFKPANPNDDQIYVIVDLKDPEHPIEAGRWWLPGMMDGEKPLRRLKALDSGNRMHNANVLPSRPDRAYVGWIDGGATILEISDKKHPRMVAWWQPSPPATGFTHTAVPHLGRGLMVVSHEAVADDCQDAPKQIWVLDIREESNPLPMSVLPLVGSEDYCKRGGRYGAHNMHENHEQPTAKELHNTVVGSFFNGGVRVFDLSDPQRPNEIAYWVPKVHPKSNLKTAQINDVFVDDRGYIYAVDRTAGGLFILEYTGSKPLS
jgi:hypothetical protein